MTPIKGRWDRGENTKPPKVTVLTDLQRLVFFFRLENDGTAIVTWVVSFHAWVIGYLRSWARAEQCSMHYNNRILRNFFMQFFDTCSVAWVENHVVVFVEFRTRDSSSLFHMWNLALNQFKIRLTWTLRKKMYYLSGGCVHCPRGNNGNASSSTYSHIDRIINVGNVEMLEYLFPQLYTLFMASTIGQECSRLCWG